jgi:hypothetical protein
MPSTALQNLEDRLKEIDQLITAHGALTRLRRAELAIGRAGGGLQAVAAAVNLLVTPPTRGRPGQVEALNKASIALLSAHLQGFIEDLFEEAAAKLLTGKVPDVQALVSNARLRGNPTADNIVRLFATAGFPDVLDGIRWQKCSNAAVRSRLKALNELRNRIVHGGTEAVGKSQVEQFKAFVQNLAERLDTKVATTVRSVTGVAPW